MNVCLEGARLQDYLDGELSPEATREMARHVAGCARCSAELSRRMVQALLFAINALAFAVASLADGWGFVNLLGQRLAPFVRALASLISHPTVETALGLAAAACVALIWWMRPSGRGPHKG